VVFTAAVLVCSIVLIIRNFWGFFWSASVLAVAYFGVTELSPEHVGLIGVAMSGFLLTEAVRDSWRQVRIVRVIENSGADAEQIADWYGVKRTWVATIQLLAVAAISAYAASVALVPQWSLITAEAERTWQQVADLLRNA